ncbi:hypothetical protein [Streptomyces parvus]|uniref:hypothetical protein n=1 Tax=Streptomyces parvus TaxID=66428 RepID=UPI0035DF1A6D
MTALDTELTALQRALDGTGTAPPTTPAERTPATQDTPAAHFTQAPQPIFVRCAEAVNTALADADRHRPALQGTPEWQDF